MSVILTTGPAFFCVCGKAISPDRHHCDIVKLVSAPVVLVDSDFNRLQHFLKGWVRKAYNTVQTVFRKHPALMIGSLIHPIRAGKDKVPVF
jgi:hypothetical protein